MSDNINAIIAQPMGIDFLTPMAKQAAISQTNQQTALLGQQTVGAEQSNELQRIQLQLRTAMARPFLGGGMPVQGQGQGSAPPADGALGGGGSAPPPMAGGGPAAAGALGPAGTAPVAPVSSSSLPPAALDTGAGSAAAAAPVGGPGAPAGGSGFSAATHSPGMPASGKPMGDVVSPYGAVQTMYGVPLPAGQAMAVVSAADPSAAIKGAMEVRRTRLQELFSQPDWNQGVQQAYQEGWIDPQHYQAFIDHPEFKSAALNGLVSPDAYANLLEKYSGQGLRLDPSTGNPEVSTVAAAAAGSQAAAKATGSAIGELPYARQLAAQRALGGAEADTVQVPTVVGRDANGEIIQNVMRNKADVATQAAGGAGGAAPTAADLVAGKPATLDQFAAQVAGRESGGNVGARQSMPGQTASGTSGFTDGTWSSFIRAQHPELANLPPAQMAALKTDPQQGAALGAEATKWYAGQNSQALSGAGLPVNTLSLGLAHNFGPDGAAAILKSPTATPIEQVVGPGVVAANPDLRGKTVGDVLGKAYGTFGASPIGGTGTQAAAPAGIPNGPRILSPQQNAGLDVVKSAISTDQGTVTTALKQAQDAQTGQSQLLQIRDLIPSINAGSFADATQRLQNVLATYAPEAAQKFTAAITAGKIDPSKATATQEIGKLLLQNAGTAEKDTLGAHGSLGAVELYQKAYPNITMQPQAMRDMTNLLLVARQRSVDYGQGVNDFYNTARDSFTGGGQYSSAQKFDSQFLQTNGPKVYVGAAAAMNDIPFSKWSSGMSPQQQQEALRVMWRADPTAQPLGPDGKTRYSNPALAAPAAAAPAVQRAASSG